MPIFTVYVNKQTGYVDNIVKEPRSFTTDKLLGVKNAAELFKSISTGTLEIPFLFDVAGLSAAQDSIALNPNLSLEKKRELIALIGTYNPLDAVNRVDFDPPGSVELGVVGAADYNAQNPPPPKPLFTHYVDP